MIMSDQDQFVGFYVTASVKDALRGEATKSGLTMSQVVREAIQDRLKILGWDLSPKMEFSQSLPLENQNETSSNETV